MNTKATVTISLQDFKIIEGYESKWQTAEGEIMNLRRLLAEYADSELRERNAKRLSDEIDRLHNELHELGNKYLNAEQQLRYCRTDKDDLIEVLTHVRQELEELKKSTTTVEEPPKTFWDKFIYLFS